MGSVYIESKLYYIYALFNSNPMRFCTMECPLFRFNCKLKQKYTNYLTFYMNAPK